MQEFQCQLDVVGQGEHSIPAGWVRLHWAIEQNTSNLGSGVAFGAEAFSWRDADNQLLQPGWVGLGFSEEAPASHPPQMINATAIFGYFDANRAPQVWSCTSLLHPIQSTLLCQDSPRSHHRKIAAAQKRSLTSLAAS